MSGARKDGDCDHGHAGQVLAFAEKVAGEHALTADSAALVFQDDSGDVVPTIIGHYNTSSLGSMAMAMLLKTSEHEPDGCEHCDAMGAAAELAAEFFIAELKRQRARRAH